MEVQPLSSYRVVDVTQNVAGPFCTQILADLGADVIKVEPIGGDSTRSWGPPFLEGGLSSMFMAFNRNKRSLTLDLKQPEARSVLDRLLSTADVFVHALRPDAAKRLQLDADTVTKHHPNLLVAEVSAFGPDGPLSDEPGYDPLVQSFSGLLSINGQEGSPPARIPTSIIDMGTGMWTALGIVSALLQKATNGNPVQVIRTSLFETALAWMPYQIIGYLGAGENPRQWGSELATLAPYGAYETADRPVMIAVGSDSLWRSFCDALGSPALATDERFSTNPLRLGHRRELRVQIEDRLRDHTGESWVEKFTSHGVPATLIKTIPEALEHPQTGAVGILTDSLDNSKSPLIGIPIAIDGERPPVRIPPPHRPGDDNTALLEGELGMSPDEIQILRSHHVIDVDRSDGYT